MLSFPAVVAEWVSEQMQIQVTEHHRFQVRISESRLGHINQKELIWYISMVLPKKLPAMASWYGSDVKLMYAIALANKATQVYRVSMYVCFPELIHNIYEYNG